MLPPHWVVEEDMQLLWYSPLCLLVNSVSLKTYITHKLLWVFDLTPDNCNRRELHLDQHGDIDVEVSFKTPTAKTITLLLYTATFGGISVGKDMQVSLLASDN